MALESCSNIIIKHHHHQPSSQAIFLKINSSPALKQRQVANRKVLLASLQERLSGIENGRCC